MDASQGGLQNESAVAVRGSESGIAGTGPASLPAGEASRGASQPGTRGAAEQALQSVAVLEGARAWLEARDAARADEDPEREAQARLTWDALRKAHIARLQRDTAGAVRFLESLGRWEDERSALYGARILPFLYGDGFESHLISTVKGAGGEQERRAAMVGLHGRGLRAAAVLGEVATDEANPVLRADATNHLAGHLTDPHVAPKRNALREAVTLNLGHGDTRVRAAAITTLSASRDALSAGTRARLKEISASDPDEGVRALAAHLLRRD